MNSARLRTRPFERLPEPPAWIPEPEASWWRTIVADYELEADGLAMLELACSALVRWRGARETIEAEGAFVEGRYGPKAHPAVGVERDARTAALRALRELDLAGEPLPYPRRVA